MQPDFYGYLTKQGGIRQSWKRRWFVLKAKFLCYYKQRQVCAFFFCFFLFCEYLFVI